MLEENQLTSLVDGTDDAGTLFVVVEVRYKHLGVRTAPGKTNVLLAEKYALIYFPYVIAVFFSLANFLVQLVSEERKSLRVITFWVLWLHPYSFFPDVVVLVDLTKLAKSYSGVREVAVESQHTLRKSETSLVLKTRLVDEKTFVVKRQVVGRTAWAEELAVETADFRVGEAQQF